MTNQATMTFLYPAPIPVGHQVEIVWPDLDVGLLGKKMEVLEQASIIRDTETGISYGTSGAFLGVDEGNAVGRRVLARVTGTRLVTNSPATPATYTVTELSLDVEPQ